MRDIVMARINEPESKLASVHTLANEYGINAGVNSVYRMMDLLNDKAIDKIQEACYQNTFGLLGEKIDVILYDCTTLYFESFIEDELKENGYSKDGKFNQSQIILALMVSSQGLPVGYEVFPGATFEGHTLANALDRMHSKYKIDKLIFAAGAAMLSVDNIRLLEGRRQPFIVGARIKNLGKELTEKILDKTQYQALYEAKEQQEQVTYRDINIQEDNLRLIVTHSPLRAGKDRHDREKAIEQVKKRLAKSKEPKSLLNNYGYKKYITITGETEISLNEEKIQQAEKWDGLHGIITNIAETTAKELLAHYKGLWQIEETFRISKHDLRMRPVFHWTPKRIKAHIALCYMALACVRTLEYKVRLQYKKLSPEAIRKHITQLEISVLKDTKTNMRYTLPSVATQDARRIYQILQLKWRETPYLIR
jgi:transposase